MITSDMPIMPVKVGEAMEVDYSSDSGYEEGALARDLVPCRSLVEADLPFLVRIGRQNTGQDTTAYYSKKVRQALTESGIRVSLVAELDDHVVGFVMARVDFGEFGQTEPTAVIDTLGVDPAYAHRHVGTALISQLLANMMTLRVERVRTEVNWDQYDLLAFLKENGFRPAQRLSFTRRVN